MEDLHSKLFHAFICRLKESNAHDDDGNIRDQFRHFIFESNFCKIDELLNLIDNDKNLAIESILLQSKVSHTFKYILIFYRGEIQLSI